jgi:hypothetical protein
MHCSDWRVFRIAIQAFSGHTVAYDAASSVARAEEALFAYSLDYHTQDVVDLIVNYSEAQCADDAACLTALLRCVGIPAHPVTADAGLETGVANWTFDTWVEFLADNGGIEWRIFHPHEYPNMTPETRGVFGLRGVANKGFNDIIVMANESWILAQLDDGTNDVSYGREPCGEPNQAITKTGWIDELCEAGYWAQPHWDCAGVRTRSFSPLGSGFRLYASELTFGGRLAGTVNLVNNIEEREFGRLTVELVTSRLESKTFTEEALHVVELPVALDPRETVMLPFDFDLPQTLAPGRELYLRATLNQRTAALMPVVVQSSLRGQVDMQTVWHVDEEGPIRVVLHNVGTAPLRAVNVEFEAPYALGVERRRPVRVDELQPGEEREVTATARAIAGLPSGSLHISIATANGGGLMLRQPFRVEEPAAPIEPRPAAELRR